MRNRFSSFSSPEINYSSTNDLVLKGDSTTHIIDNRTGQRLKRKPGDLYLDDFDLSRFVMMCSVEQLTPLQMQEVAVLCCI